MNMHKHMEAIFIVTLVVVSTATFAFDSLREAETSQSASATAAREVRTVVVRAPAPAQRA
ncbi:hypothetical protein [Massilia litorea]|jgi:hypothetical protein|uniref:Uncharacterized protein n=1 Tax=Massilia litorea TaxID=2769491 RepID=A0A7L9U0I4_9BURK|nr:hypothetical protein [Massilia litorea]QOL48524.1 hypothetical protein LPB04_16350 [Massilia litorea]